MADYNPFDPSGDVYSTRRRKLTGYAPITSEVETGIPEPYSPPTGGINPDGMYSGGTNPTVTSSTGIPQTAPTQPTRYQSIVDAYNTYLGRTPSQQEVYSHVGGGSWSESDPRIQYSISNIMNSPEAMQYRLSRTSTSAPTTTSSPVSTSAMPGWDQSKWADSSHTTPKYQVGRILSQFPHTPAGAQQAMAEIQKLFPNATFDGKDILTIPGVGSWDIIQGADLGGQAWSWQTLTDENGNPIGGGQAPAPSSGGGAAAPNYGSSGASNGGGAFGDQIRRKIMELMGQSPKDVMSDPVYTGAMDAYNTQQQRNTAIERNAMAERMNAEGTLNTGGFTDRVMQGEQAAGERKASFAGNLAVRELERQRDEIMQALQLGAGLMTDEQRLALTEKLGLINANLQQQSITNQNNQFNQNLGWDMSQFQWLQNLLPFTTA